MRFQKVIAKSDFTIIGAGMSGICAAIQAARLGLTVSLINNRGFLGGNASPEIRVNVSGADGSSEFNFYARESGILEEIRLENLYRNPQGNPYLWHTVLLDFVLREKNIILYLNTNVDEVMTKEDGSLKWVCGSQMGTEKRFQFESPYFLDDTGDGTIGYLAGATYRMGRESKDEFNEKLAPNEADDNTLLSTLSFYSKDTKRKSPFQLPEFAKAISLDEALENRVIPDRIPGHSRYEAYRMRWFYEVGYGKHPINDAEDIMQNHRELVYNIWNHIKNSNQYDSETFDLEYISPIAGKRESRRLMGDYILTESDIVNQKDFEDAIGHGGWSLDLHAPEGFFSKDDTTRHNILNGVYSIPYRTCYSKDTHNLFIASRALSATHVAFGSTRVMGTLAVLGQSVAIAAYLCKKYNVSPREIYNTHLEEFQQELIKNDQYIIGAINKDQKDLARNAHITTSSSQKLCFTNKTHEKLLDEDIALIIPVDNNIDEISLYLKASSNTTLSYTVFTPTKEQNYKPQKQLLSSTINVDSTSEFIWIKLPLNIKTNTGKIFLQIHENKKINLAMSKEQINGVFYLTKQILEEHSTYVDVNTLKHVDSLWIRNNNIPCFKVNNENIYSGSNINNGYSRNHRLPNLWLSDKDNNSEWISIKFNEINDIKQLILTFDSHLDVIYHNFEIYNDFNVFPHIVKNYKILAKQGEDFIEVKSITDNYQRKNIINFPQISTDEIKIVFTQTNGSPRVSVYEIRAY